MATRKISKTNIVGVSSIAFIRAMPIQFTITGVKPLTRLYAWFDGVSVDQYITPTNLTTDANGNASGTFNLPPATFNTGIRTLRFQDTNILQSDIAGSLVGSAQADFTTTAIRKTLQETVTNITIVPPPPPPPPADPIAQTFFTYGIKGGCYITKIDVYFQSKDANIPIAMDIRAVENGYPSNKFVSKTSTKTLNPSQVYTSTDASIPTSFVFDTPVYLEENKDYCFVLRSNCNSYHVWTSKLGEKSIETGQTVFEQPFIGTLFKSENNITWTAEQTEDIKFTIYKAKFDTTKQSNVVFSSKSDPVLILGENMSVNSGSAVVTATFPFKHSLQTASWIKLYPLTGASYRGITAANISGDFQITRTNDYTITFSAKTAATSTGTLSSIGFVKTILIDAGGSAYTNNSSLSFSGGSGSGAAGFITAVNGVITGVTITNGGSGYTSAPTVTVNGSGSGASLVAITEAIFGIETNRIIHTYAPIVESSVVPDTSIDSTFKPILSSYNTQGNTYPVKLNSENSIPDNGWLVSSVNDTQLASGQGNYFTKVINSLTSDNENTSPSIFLNTTSRLVGENFIINSSTEIGSSETAASGGSALSKYITKPITLANTSKGARVFVSAYSRKESGFDVYIRTSASGSGVTHKTQTWTKMTCDTPERNLSSKIGEFVDYTFYIDNQAPFDVYDLKIVMYTTNTAIVPIIQNYRVIILAS